MVMPIQFRFDREVENHFVHTILEMACEPGSIEYWANPDVGSDGEFKTTDTDSDGTYTLEVRISIDDEPVPGFAQKQTIDGQVINTGIKRLLTGEVHLDAEPLGRLLYAVINSETDELDGDLVDSIVQAGLFNDIVFG
jgi:hypothetical protein